VAPTGTKGLVEISGKKIPKTIRIYFLDFLNFHIFGYLNCLTVSTLISNHPHSYVKVHTCGQTSRSVTHPHTALSLLASKTALATS
jgi:hypothetical protein